MKEKCQYCEYKTVMAYVGKTPQTASDGLRVYIKAEKLTVEGWFDNFVGMKPLEVKINYCPMCGRDMRDK